MHACTLTLRRRQTVLENITKLGKEAKLQSFEQAKAVYLFPGLMSVENDLLTPTFKCKRPQATKFFQKQLDALYKALDEK